MNLQLQIIAVVCAVLLQIAALAFTYKYGHDMGYADANTKQQAANIQSLNKSISDLETATQRADRVSLQLNQSISDRKQADQQSTKELRDALSNTAHLRIGCLFDDGVMQKLHTAADTADKAAATGFISPVPTGTSPGQ